MAARVLLVDALDRLLLLHASLPDGRGIWLPPGGGIEPDETAEQAAIREVREAEIVAANDQLFVPPTLGANLGPLLAGILPGEPFDLGI
jgi:ADP-ribose pyrophosphatase YjhB (NUDIX family)